MNNSYFYSNRDINTEGYADNNCHKHLCKKAKDMVLISILKEPDVEGSLSLDQLYIDYKDETSKNMKEEIVASNILELEGKGLILPLDSSQRYEDSLVVSYFLNSSICYIKGDNNKTYLVTKSREIVLSLIEDIYSTDLEKINRFKDVFKTAVDEIKTNTFNVMVIEKDFEGLRLSEAKIDMTSEALMLNTLYFIDNYNRMIIRTLKEFRLKITYTTGEETAVVKTTLINHELVEHLKLREWTGQAIVSELQNKAQCRYDLGELTLIDLDSKSKKFVTINCLDIVSIKKY